MLIFSNVLKDSFRSYSNKSTKLSREVKKRNYIKVKNGLYETDSNTPGYLIASALYGPSYISFEYALSLYGLIPERVNTITCATFDKKKKKEFQTFFGLFTYRDVPRDAYSEEIDLKIENGYTYQIASKEKAICDKLYTLPPLNNYSNLENMLFNDLRIDAEEFKKLDINKIIKLSELYHSTNVDLLAGYLRRNINE